mmetsp:Transcript_8553/g.24017  ORF Transcript_8553/g.24017 Transcript_8553/m.24017 type:complete len:299 (+) Transcript_8553:204-1100(+)
MEARQHSELISLCIAVAAHWTLVLALRAALPVRAVAKVPGGQPRNHQLRGLAGALSIPNPLAQLQQLLVAHVVHVHGSRMVSRLVSRMVSRKVSCCTSQAAEEGLVLEVLLHQEQRQRLVLVQQQRRRRRRRVGGPAPRHLRSPSVAMLTPLIRACRAARTTASSLKALLLLKCQHVRKGLVVVCELRRRQWASAPRPLSPGRRRGRRAAAGANDGGARKDAAAAGGPRRGAQARRPLHATGAGGRAAAGHAPGGHAATSLGAAPAPGGLGACAKAASHRRLALAADLQQRSLGAVRR